MGVRGLETFLRKQVPNGVFSVNILDEINSKKMNYPDQRAVLVFQVIDILFNVAHNLSNTEKICGPAFVRLHEIFDNCFHELQNSGVELHFFLSVNNHDFQRWAHKESENYSSRIAVIDQIDSDIPIDQIKHIEKSDATAPTYDLINVCKKYGTLHVSQNRQYIVDVVKYANESDALAIVGNSSDFLIFNGNWRYWSCRDIGLMERNWNTVEYNKAALLEYIGLSQLQMPMLSTIAGNDFVAYEKVTQFHKKIISGTVIDYHMVHFLKLAEYVQKIPTVLTNDEKRQFLFDLFGSTESRNFEMVRESLLFYTTKIQETQDVDSLLSAAASVGVIYYNSLIEAPIRIKIPIFFDMRRSDFLPYGDIILPILKRQIGVVRQHKNDYDYEQTIEIKLRHSEPFRCIRVKPEYPIAVAILDLMELSFNRNNDYFNNYRFRLLKWMVFGGDTHPQFSIQHIPNGYMVTVVAVMYLCKLKQLTSAEADAILLSIHMIHINDDYFKNVDVPTNVSSRDVIASHLYICVHNIVLKCFLFVGLNSFVDVLSIDGVYFVHWLNKIKTEDCEEILSQIEHLRNFLQFI